MKLPDLILMTKANQRLQNTGIDSPDLCQDRQWFQKFPHHVEYHFNDRGFRDTAWPKWIQGQIWCVGDSFTVGLGSPFEHIWPQVLQRRLQKRCINVSMDGASNDWIASMARYILDHANPLHVICMWSHVERRQLDAGIVAKTQWNKFYNDVRDSSWPNCELEEFDTLDIKIRQEIRDHHKNPFIEISEDLKMAEVLVPDEWRIMQDIMASDQDNIADFDQTTSRVRDEVINATVPDFASKDITDVCRNLLPAQKTIPDLVRLDLARDGHHFDIKTAEWVADRVIERM